MKRRSDMNRASTVVLLLVAIAASCGCDSRLRLSPMPVIYGPGRLDLCSIIPESRRGRDMLVFYATNRKPDGPVENRTYGNDVDDSLHLGLSTVEMGDEGESWDDLCKASSGKGGNPPFSLKRSSEFADEASYYEAINQQLALTPNHEVNIYVHGFFTDLPTSVSLLGKLFHCSGRRGVMLCFSWPARQNAYLYGKDLERGRASAHYLADLIERVAANTNAENINVLAYSAGAPCATDAILELRKRHPDQTPEQLAKRFRIGNIIYAASDIDTKTFGREQIVRLKELAQHVIIYVSKNDSVLGLASFASGGASRLGNPDVTTFTKAEQEAVAKDPQIQVIDVSDVPGPQGYGGVGGHYYWYTNDWVMTDVLVSFRWQISPDQRGLYRKPGMARWWFPKDYPEKVSAAVVQLVSPPSTMPVDP